jgi:penicillin-binding protein 1A
VPLFRVRFKDRIAAARRFFRADGNDPPRKWLRRHWRLTTAFGAALTFMLVFDAWLVTCGFDGCPNASAIRTYRPPEGSRVLDRFGKPMGRVNRVQRVNVSLSMVPEHVQRAFIATEDRRFFEHNGLDWRAVGRAIVRNTTSLRVREGFSTITMQVARNTIIADRANGSRSLGR